MALFLDSASPDDAREALSFSLGAGINANPTLIAKVSRKTRGVITELANICPWSWAIICCPKTKRRICPFGFASLNRRHA